ncbi:hypothetical protein PR001_g20856 [Phytophthora rubi]|uniref:Uncharacterized protein n=1 Tax=Phytophthora rubi TaxID=129364 RepID=A0A6A3JDD1_9STRA|nr:hypothetical protein PR001_g20856 [Phytophthora rubi]
MYWILSKKLGLKVQEMEHPMTERTGVKAQHWDVRVHAASCPPALRQKSYIGVDSAEIVIHHANTHVNWPCRRCQSPEHPAKYCKVLDTELEAALTKHTLALEGKLPSNLVQSSRDYGAGSQPKTMEDLEAMLRQEGRLFEKKPGTQRNAG